MKKKIMLIAGCSHTAGSEIDGMEDSQYNRDNSFGNRLAKRLGYEPINIAINGSNNTSIARSILDWTHENYDSKEIELYVLIAWTESTRMEIPSTRMFYYDRSNPYVSFFSQSNNLFLRVGFGSVGFDKWETEQLEHYQKFIANNCAYLEILTLNLILQMQYFLKSENIKYLMCNTMYPIPDTSQNRLYIEKIDKKRYFNFLDKDSSFYWKYKNAGYVNDKAKYWHHNEIPHGLYAEELYQFIIDNNLL
jgi:hypothetical protein